MFLYNPLDNGYDLPPREWWALAKRTLDAYVASFPVRPYKLRMRARSAGMNVISRLAAAHPQAPELARLLREAGY